MADDGYFYGSQIAKSERVDLETENKILAERFVESEAENQRLREVINKALEIHHNIRQISPYYFDPPEWCSHKTCYVGRKMIFEILEKAV